MHEHFTGAHEIPSPDADPRALWRWFRKLSFLTQSVSIRRNSVSGWHTGLIFKFVPAGKGPVSFGFQALSGVVTGTEEYRAVHRAAGVYESAPESGEGRGHA